MEDGEPVFIRSLQDPMSLPVVAVESLLPSRGLGSSISVSLSPPGSPGTL